MKKGIAGAVSLSLAFTLLAGCGGGKENTSGDNTAAGDNAVKPELRQLGFARNFDPNTDPVAKYLEEKTGYKVKYEALPLENFDDKLNLLMANKEPYDILKLSGSQYNRLAAQGALEPLDDLLAKYGKTLTQVNAQDTFENAKVDGKIYGIPEKHPRAFVGSSLAIRQDLLDDLGMKVPTTIDEFYNLLKALKEKKNIIPLTAYNGIIPEIAGAFGIQTSWQDAAGKLRHRLEDPNMKEYLAFMNKLYTEGLLDTEFPVNKAATIQQKFTSGKAGIMEYGWGVASATTDALKKTFPDAKITIIPALKGKDGKVSNWLQGGGVSWYIAIPKASKHKEDAMKYMDLKVQADTFKGLAIGVEGVDYKVENGQINPILPQFNTDRGQADWFMTSTDSKAYEEQWLIRVRKDKVLYEAFEEIQKQASVSVKDPTLLAPPLPVVGNNMQKLNKLETDYLVKVIAGAEKLTGYDNFVSQWKSQGGTEVIQALSDWYAKQKK